MASEVPQSSVRVKYAHGTQTNFPVHLFENGIAVDVKLNEGSHSLRFMIDSGAGSTYIDAKTARDKGLTLTGEGAIHGAGSGTVPVQHVDHVRFDLPGVTTWHEKINALDFGALDDSGQPGVVGILGFDFIRQFVVTIDYDTGHVLLSTPDTFVYNGGGTVLPIEFRGRWPYISGELTVTGVPAKTCHFLVDSGSGDAVNHPLIRESKGRLAPTRTGVGFGEPGQGVIGRIETLRLGPLEIHDAPSVSGEGNEAFKVDGQIGTEVLKRFKVIFDYARSRMILEPGKAYAQPFR